MIPAQKYASAGTAIQVLESASRLNAAVWAGYASVQAASLGARTPTPWSGAALLFGTVSAAASFAYAGVEMANLTSLLLGGAPIDEKTAEKVKEVLDLLEDPLMTAVEAAELLFSGSSPGSKTYEVLNAAKEALETFRNSDNLLERLAALEKIWQALQNLAPSDSALPSSQPATPPMPSPHGTPDRFELQGSEFGPMAGEPYHTPGESYA